MDLSEVGPEINSEQVESSPDDSNLMYDYFDQPSAQIPELPWEVLDSHTEVGENHRQASESYNHVTDVPVSTSETSQLGRGFNHSPQSRSVPAVYPASQNHELQRTPTAVRRDVKEASVLPEEAAVPEVEMNTQSWGEEETPAGGPEQAAEDEKWTEVSEASDQNPSFSAGLEPEEQIHLRPDMVEPLSDHRGNSNVRNHSAVPHLPGDQLFEVAVEVTFPQDLESWDDQARSLLLSVKTLISKQLEALHSPLSMSSKRIKRLNAGVLYILWLQIKQSPGGLQGHRAVHSALQGLIAMRVSFRESHETAVIISMSTADVNECGTQLVLCDINADCVNHFGSYSCHCRPGFQDESRLGSGGTVCVDLKAAGCSSGLSAETRGVYVLFFLLSTLILMLLVVAGVMYQVFPVSLPQQQQQHLSS
uniref:EGF-like domain-containing protein n=1 Tax=Monopterus albus TaxID=43700 RepID=A0A3Q3RDC4_MONAL